MGKISGRHRTRVLLVVVVRGQYSRAGAVLLVVVMHSSNLFFFLAYSFQALCIIFSRGDFITLMGIWAISLDRNQNIMLDFRLWVGPKY